MNVTEQRVIIKVRGCEGTRVLDIGAERALNRQQIRLVTVRRELATPR